jgi:hypothetical protein
VELVVRIPKDKSASVWPGVVHLDTGLGEMAISSVSAEKGIWHAVTPLAQYAVTVSGDVDGRYLTKFYDAPLGLEPAGTLFRYGEGVQRQLGRNEPIYWGTNYWLVGQADSLRLSRAPAAINVDISDLRSPWVVGLITLPPSEQVAGDQQTLAERWLRRSISVGRETFSFIDPLPHHFDSDGTPVFEEDTRTLRLRCPSGASLLFYTDSGRQADVEVDRLSGEHEVRLGSSGTWHALLGGRHGGSVRLEDCAALVPPRVLLECQGESVLIPTCDSDALLKRALASRASIQLSADADVLRDLVTVDNAAWPPTESLVWPIAAFRKGKLYIDVRGVGAIGDTGVDAAPGGMVKPELEIVAAWLWSVSDPAHSSGSPVKLTLPTSSLPAIVRRLEGRRWKAKFAAHVRVLQTRLDQGAGRDI